MQLAEVFCDQLYIFNLGLKKRLQVFVQTQQKSQCTDTWEKS